MEEYASQESDICLVWGSGVGAGYSGATVAAGAVNTTGSVDNTLKIFAYDIGIDPDSAPVLPTIEVA